ncbi:MAG TPA: alpha/beta hydrolase [Candidatus Binataceae bacterium]|nr:alpha/beta hydrolase [Candidatus Binataceae bacterium]
MKAETPLAHHTAALDGVTLHYVIAGRGDPVVLLHGWPQTWYEWRYIIPALADRYTVIAPDMRGIGDSSRPVTGYDKRTIADDIYQLVRKLGFEKIFLVGHDWGGPVAYAYACAHPDDVRKLVILDVTIPGEAWENIRQVNRRGGIWHLAFHNVRDLPEALVAGRERVYLSWFYRSAAYNPTAISEADIDEYARCYSAPGAMRAGFEYYRAIFTDIDHNKENARTKLKMPVLALGGERGFHNLPLRSMKDLAENIRGGVVERSGHWIPEERPDYLIDQLTGFFAEK